MPGTWTGFGVEDQENPHLVVTILQPLESGKKLEELQKKIAECILVPMGGILQMRDFLEVVEQAAFVCAFKCNVVLPTMNKAAVVTNYIRMRIS